MKEKIINYLTEYEKLCQKYNMYIDGCGCSDSPYLSEKIKIENEEVSITIGINNIYFNNNHLTFNMDIDKFNQKFKNYDEYNTFKVLYNQTIENLKKIDIK